MSSQYGQDMWVAQMLNGKFNGFFLDTGAGMGVVGSNTHLLEAQFGWNGICAEPVPEFFADVKANRRCACFNVAVNDKPGPVVFSMTENRWLAGIYSEFSDWAKDRNKADVMPKVTVEAWTLKMLLDAGKAPRLIDYWSLDTEGSEWTLVRSFPWDEHDVTLLSVEHNNEEPKRTLIKAFLTQKGYAFIQRPVAEFEDYYAKLAAPTA